MTLLLGWPNRHASTSPVGFARTRPTAPVHSAPDPERRMPLADPNREGHWLCVAPTGSGKSASFAIPQLLSYPGSIIAVDVKGELAEITARHRATLGEVMILDPFNQVPGSDGAFDPLSHLDPASPGIVDDAYTLANLFSGGGDSSARLNEKFWDDWGQDIIAALIVHVLRDEDPAKRSLAEVYRRFHGNDPIYDLAVMLDTERPHPFTLAKIGAFLNLPEITRGGVSATANQQLRMLAGQGVQDSFSHNSIDMQALTDGAPSTIYLVMPPERLESHSGLVRIVLTALLQRLLRRRRRPSHPTLLMVDEAAQLGPMNALTSAITLGRGYGIRAALLVQSFAQLRNSYGPTCATLMENCALMTMGPLKAFDMARQLSELGFGDVTAEALFGLSDDDVVIRTGGQPSRRLRKLDYLTDAMFAGRFDPNPFHEPMPAMAEVAKRSAL